MCGLCRYVGSYRRKTGITVPIGNWDIRAWVTWDEYPGDQFTEPSWEIERVDVTLVRHWARGFEPIQPTLVLTPHVIANMGAGWVQWLVRGVWDYVEENLTRAGG